MVTQIEAPGPPEETESHRLFGENACRGEARQHTREVRPRTQGVGKDATYDTALDRRSQGLDDPSHRRVVGHDVEQQVDMVARRVDVGDQAVDELIVVGQHFDGVAVEDR